mmetsp:Transcript_7966/g.20898  ORF Transcript_7966/g.20898 Transcript_7966/m.20898 type:complete len:202 (-) Transcript_7966:203-808(-)
MIDLLEIVLEFGEDHRLRWRRAARSGARARREEQLMLRLLRAPLGARRVHCVEDVLRGVARDARRESALRLAVDLCEGRVVCRQPDRLRKPQVGLGVPHHQRLQQRREPRRTLLLQARHRLGDLRLPPRAVAPLHLVVRRRGRGVDAVGGLAQEAEQALKLRDGSLCAQHLVADDRRARHDPAPLGGKRGDELVGGAHLPE